MLSQRINCISPALSPTALCLIWRMAFVSVKGSDGSSLELVFPRLSALYRALQRGGDSRTGFAHSAPRPSSGVPASGEGPEKGAAPCHFPNFFLMR